MARASDAAIGVHVDHSRDLDEIELCIQASESVARTGVDVMATHDTVALWRAGRNTVTAAAVRSIQTLTGAADRPTASRVVQPPGSTRTA